MQWTPTPHAATHALPGRLLRSRFNCSTLLLFLLEFSLPFLVLFFPLIVMFHVRSIQQIWDGNQSGNEVVELISWHSLMTRLPTTRTPWQRLHACLTKRVTAWYQRLRPKNDIQTYGTLHIMVQLFNSRRRKAYSSVSTAITDLT